MEKSDQASEESLSKALEAFDRDLARRAYKVKTIAQYVCMGRYFGEFLGRAGTALTKVGEGHIEEFLSERFDHRRAGRRLQRLKQFWRRPLRLFVGLVLGQRPAAPARTRTRIALTAELQEYLQYLQEHRGLCERTISRQRLQVGRLLVDVPNVRRLTIDQIDRYLVRVGRRFRRETTCAVTASIRGFLGHLYMRGLLSADLRCQVTTPRIYALASLPRSIAWSEIERVLSTIDRTTVIGVRDYAMLKLIAHCGLRAGDVAALQVRDVDWRRDVLHVPRPKQRTKEPVPLVPAVGEALIAYLQQRPDVPYEHIFLKHYAPIAPLKDVQISQRARKHLTRAGVRAPKLGSHTLRHSFAVEMLRRGHAPRAIGAVMGHTHPQSTYVYLKAAVDDLRSVALETEEVAP